MRTPKHLINIFIHMHSDPTGRGKPFLYYLQPDIELHVIWLMTYVRKRSKACGSNRLGLNNLELLVIAD